MNYASGTFDFTPPFTDSQIRSFTTTFALLTWHAGNQLARFWNPFNLPGLINAHTHTFSSALARKLLAGETPIACFCLHKPSLIGQLKCRYATCLSSMAHIYLCVGVFVYFGIILLFQLVDTTLRNGPWRKEFVLSLVYRTQNSASR